MKRSDKSQGFRYSWILYLLLVGLIILYAMVSVPLIGAAVVVLIVLILYIEVKYSIKSEGTERTAIDIVSAVGAAIAAYIIVIFLLQTSSPIDAVSSCSMLPVLHRGDLVILHGLGNVTQFLLNTHVPVVNVSPALFQQMINHMPNEFLAFYAYLNGNKSEISYPIPNGAQYQIGLYNTSCISTYQYYGQPSHLNRCFVSQQAANASLIGFSYSVGNLSLSNQAFSAPYTSQIYIGSIPVVENYSNPIIVYQTTSTDTFSGSIIHRLVAVLDAGGKYYFLTKGDNNPALDIEFGNYPANQSSVLGYVIADVPVIGYIKLLLSGQIEAPQGCDQLLQR